MNRWIARAPWLLAACAGIAEAQPLTFTSLTIDQHNSGDCKAVGDIDLDGKADAVVGGYSLVWYESGASFAKWTIRPNVVYQEFTTDMKLADLDGDGDLDIVIADGNGTGNILWFVNPVRTLPPGGEADPREASNWTYRIIGTQGNNVHDIEVADLDGDGQIEIVTSGHVITKVWKRAANGSWLMKDLSSMAGDGIFLGDIDRDGLLDIATPRAWLRNPGDIINGSWTRFIISGATTGDECLLADLNGDGRLDLITCDAHQRGPFVWFEQPAVATSSAWTKRVIDPLMGAHQPEAADFNLDGRIDILMGLESSDLAVYINLGGSPPTFEKVLVATSGGHNARFGDLTGNGVPDILACDWVGNPPVRVHLNNLAPSAPCYANCDGSTSSPVLTPNDMACFINAFAAGSEYANCDLSPPIPTLTPNDYQCFLNKFAALDPYANCDGSTGVPALSANDFQCFMSKFAAQDPYANCDGSEPVPSLTANDFACYLNHYAAGCR
jgi:hypothetical protein